MGVNRTPVCGTFVCGDGTICGQWYASFDKAEVVLNAKIFEAVFSPEGLVTLIFFPAKLRLNPKPVAVSLSTTLSFSPARLLLTGKPFTIQPYITLVFEQARLLLRGKPLTLGLSAALNFARPLLTLKANPPRRVGQPGLIPTVPETIILTPTAPEEGPLLVPTVPETALLVPTKERSL